MEPQEITTEWLRSRLGWKVADGDRISIERIGAGKGLLGRIFRIHCEGRSHTGSFVLKTSPPKGSTWDGFISTIAPFARESRAYQLLSRGLDRVKSVIPVCYWSTYHEDGTGAIALEDLTLRKAFTVAAQDGLSRVQAQAALRSLATVHSAFACFNPPASPLRPPNSWLFSASSPELAPFMTEALNRTMAIAADQFPEEFTPDLLQVLRQWDVPATMASSHQGSRLISLCHGDAWSNNVMFAISESASSSSISAILLDWQLAMWGNPLSDVAFLLLSSLEPSLRRSCTEELLAFYHSEVLRGATGTIQYSLGECIMDFKRAIGHGALMSLTNLEAFVNDVPKAQLPSIARRLSAVLVDSM
jgi:hypothetical protein